MISNTALHITFLANVIFNQDKDLTNDDRVQVENNVKLVKAQKEGILQDEYNLLLEEVVVRTKRSMALAREKGSGSWLTALPIKSLGYTSNKREFQDSICLRYDWRIPNKPSYCLCGVNNDINHALSCKKGGYVMMRHNCIRDLEAEIMQEVCSDVRIEPETCHHSGTMQRSF